MIYICIYRVGWFNDLSFSDVDDGRKNGKAVFTHSTPSHFISSLVLAHTYALYLLPQLPAVQSCKPRFLHSVRQHLIHPRDLAGDTVVDRALANLDNQAAEDLWVDLGHHFQLLALRILGFGDRGFETFNGFIVEFL